VAVAQACRVACWIPSVPGWGWVFSAWCPPGVSRLPPVHSSWPGLTALEGALRVWGSPRRHVLCLGTKPWWQIKLSRGLGGVHR
jgi:hypothetical protein